MFIARQSPGCARAEGVSRGALKAEAGARSRASTLGICGEQCGTKRDFSPVSPCQCNSTNASYPSCFEHWSYQNDKVAQPRNLKKFNAVSEIGTVLENIDTFFF